MGKSKSTLDMTGVYHGLIAYLLWGLLPIYWKLLSHVPAMDILAHRIIWSFLIVVILIAKNNLWYEVKEVLKDKKRIFYLILSSITITINWGLFIWAVNSNYIIQTSIGYYITPLLVVFFGLVIFKEKLNVWQLTALTFAFLGVIILTLQYGSFPWISIVLAIAFAAYGLFKKTTKVSIIVGLAMETALITPLAILYLVFNPATGGVFSISMGTFLLLIGSGFATAVPLLLFASSATRIPLTTLGFIQYLAPTISLLIGVFVYREVFSRVHSISFGLIWLGLTIFTLSHTKLIKKSEVPGTSDLRENA
jgi:chloramphenicol-sensitive protein RarD